MKKLLITGGAGRLGGAIARRMAQDGWHIVIADRDGAAARALAGALWGTASIEAATMDVTDLAQVKATVARHGPFAGLVNAAGGRIGAEAGPFAESAPESWKSIVDLHLRGTLNVCYAVLPGMIAAKSGAIVSLAAVEGLRGDPRGAVFSAAKAGVVVLTETLVRECRPHRIRVNAIVPGHPPARLRDGNADDSEAVAAAAAFLLSDEASRTTGACLDVTGGWALH